MGNTVGTGIVPQAKTGNAGLDKIIDAEWPYFVEACDTPQRLDFYGMQALIMRTMAESGESIVRFRPRLAQDNLRVPLQLQLLEADFLDHARTMGTVNGHVMQGVQFDLLGRRVGLLDLHVPSGRNADYESARRHPQPAGAGRADSAFVPRAAAWPDPRRALVVAGDDGVARPRRLRRCGAGAQEDRGMCGRHGHAAGGHRGIVARAPEGNDPRTRHPMEEFQPGQVAYLKPGEDVKFNNPPAAWRLPRIQDDRAAGHHGRLGLALRALAPETSRKVNYSSWRGGQLGFRNTIEELPVADIDPDVLHAGAPPHDRHAPDAG